MLLLSSISLIMKWIGGMRQVDTEFQVVYIFRGRVIKGIIFHRVGCTLSFGKHVCVDEYSCNNKICNRVYSLSCNLGVE
jgi:hypothetical protein